MKSLFKHTYKDVLIEYCKYRKIPYRIKKNILILGTKKLWVTLTLSPNMNIGKAILRIDDMLLYDSTGKFFRVVGE